MTKKWPKIAIYYQKMPKDSPKMPKDDQKCPNITKKCPKIPLITAEWTNVAAVIDIISLISPRRNISQRRKHRWHHYGQSASPSIDNEITIPFPLILLVKLTGSQIQSQTIVLISRMSENEHVSEILKRSYLPLSWNSPQEKLFLVKMCSL